MKLGDYLELRKRGWNDSAAEVVELPTMIERYHAKVNEIQAIIESLDEKSLALEINFKGR